MITPDVARQLIFATVIDTGRPLVVSPKSGRVLVGKGCNARLRNAIRRHDRAVADEIHWLSNHQPAEAPQLVERCQSWQGAGLDEIEALRLALAAHNFASGQAWIEAHRRWIGRALSNLSGLNDDWAVLETFTRWFIEPGSNALDAALCFGWSYQRMFGLKSDVPSRDHISAIPRLFLEVPHGEFIMQFSPSAVTVRMPDGSIHEWPCHASDDCVPWWELAPRWQPSITPNNLPPSQ